MRRSTFSACFLLFLAAQLQSAAQGTMRPSTFAAGISAAEQPISIAQLAARQEAVPQTPVESSIPGCHALGEHGINCSTIITGKTVEMSSGTVQDALAMLPTGGTITITGAMSVSTTITIPANVKIRVEAGGTLVVPPGKILTIQGPFEADLHQVFPASGKVVFAPGSLKSIFVGWWYSGAGSWDAAIAAAYPACTAARVWCDLPAVLSTSNALSLSDHTMLRSFTNASGGGNNSHSYGTVWTLAPAAAKISGLYGSHLHNIQIQGISFIASNANGYYPQAAVYLDGALDCALEHVQVAGAFTTAGILLSGLQECQIGSSNTGINIINTSTSATAEAGVRFLGPESDPAGTLSTTVELHKLTINGMPSSQGGIKNGLVFDGDACLGCNVYNMMVETVSGNAVRIAKGNTIDFYSPYIENAPNIDSAVGLFRIGQDDPTAHYGTQVNIFGGEINGTNTGGTQNVAFDLGASFGNLNVDGTQIGRVGRLQNIASTCYYCKLSLRNVVAGLGAGGFGSVSPQAANQIDFLPGNRIFSAAVGASGNQMPQFSRMAPGRATSAPPYFNAPGQLAWTQDKGLMVWDTYGSNAGAWIPATQTSSVQSTAAIAAYDATAQTTDLPAVALYNVPPGKGGSYLAGCYIVQTRAATTSSTLPACYIEAIDQDTGLPASFQTTKAIVQNQIGATGRDGSNSGTVSLHVAAGSKIMLSTQGYTSKGSTLASYAIHAWVQFMHP